MLGEGRDALTLRLACRAAGGDACVPSCVEGRCALPLAGGGARVVAVINVENLYQILGGRLGLEGKHCDCILVYEARGGVSVASVELKGSLPPRGFERHVRDVAAKHYNCLTLARKLLGPPELSGYRLECYTLYSRPAPAASLLTSYARIFKSVVEELAGAGGLRCANWGRPGIVAACGQRLW